MTQDLCIKLLNITHFFIARRGGSDDYRLTIGSLFTEYQLLLAAVTLTVPELLPPPQWQWCDEGVLA